ncbi:MAG: heat-inducible transcriptional repressor HrcA [Firmicutes bacterium]|nr:heat-inducible transcriptional repressor HrcA [Bacillota bacterium]
MKLSERKEKIIEAVVDTYIKECTPISSGDIQKSYLQDVSSATIRNELAVLEDMGYLVQPHTSSGRIPTAEAYRHYVEKLMPKRKLTKDELKIVNKYFNRKITELDEILKATAKVITQITNLTSVAYIKNAKEAFIESVKIVKLSANQALFVVVTNIGVIKDAVAHIESGDIGEEYFVRASEFITSVLRGKSVFEAATNMALYEAVLAEYQFIFDATMHILKSHANEAVLPDIVLEGSARILEQPEYANLNKAKAMLELLDAKEELVPVLAGSDMSLNILISKDDELKEGLPECAIVTANYSVGGKSIGKAGVIGPIRMDYSKVISVLDYISKAINLMPNSERTNESDSEDIIGEVID